MGACVKGLRRPGAPAASHRRSSTVIPGRIEDANPESRDSPMRNCASEVRANARPGMTEPNTPSRSRDAMRPRFSNHPPPKRAWGMPGAQCTRSLVCESGGWNAHEYSQRVHRKTPGIPTQWFTAYSALSPVIGFLATVAGGKLRRLDASTEASGPHGFAVRIGAVRQERRRVHRIQPRVRDDRDRPSGGVDGASSTLICDF